MDTDDHEPEPETEGDVANRDDPHPVGDVAN